MRLGTCIAGLLFVLASACKGTIGTANESPPLPPLAPCEETDCETPLIPDSPVGGIDLGVRFLNPMQFSRALRSRVFLFVENEVARRRVDDALEQYLEENEHTRYLGAAARAQDSAPFVGYAVPIFIAAEQLVDRSVTDVVFGECARDEDVANDAECIRHFLDSHLHTFWRRPVSESEKDEIVVSLTADGIAFQGDQVRRLFVALFMAPDFLFTLESGEGEVIAEERDDQTELRRLSAYELASRLSFFLWQDAPDDELLEEARSGRLFDEDALRAQAERLLEDPRSAALFEVLGMRWLGLEREELDLSPVIPVPRYSYALRRLYAREGGRPLAGEVDGAGETMPARFGWYEELFPETDWWLHRRHLFFDDLVDSMVVDMSEYFRHVVVENEGTLRDVLTQELMTAQDPRIAGLYGTTPWDGESEPPTQDQGRGGLLGRIVNLAFPSTVTRPVLRSVRLWEHTLCRSFPPTPNDIQFSPPSATPYTTRELIEETTSDDSCVGCHGRINGIGFAFESFGILGEHRSEELFLGEELGNTLSEVIDYEDANTLPINTSGVAYIDPAFPTSIENAADLGSAIADYQNTEVGATVDAYRCLTQHLLATGYDGAVLDPEESDVIEELVRTSSLRDAILALVSSSSFQQRRFATEEEL